MDSRKEKEVIKRNAELRQQLADNARKLKIEAGLEKVRAVALKMKKPADMLEVCKTISLQLEKLGVKEIRNVQTAIFYENKGTYMNYEYYAKHKKTIITETVYTNHKVAKAFAAKMLSGKGEVYITHIKGKKVKDWIAYQKTTNVFIDRFLEKANSLSYYWHSLGPVALGISTYTPLLKDDLNLFQRFLKVFELAYTRYLDLEQAIAQAREAQIEAALEKVRSRSLAMHKSDEIEQVLHAVFERLKELNIDFYTAIIILFIKDSKDIVWWLESKANHLYPRILIPYTGIDYLKSLFEARENEKVIFSKCYSFEQKNELFHHLFDHTDFKYVPAEQKKFLLGAEFATMSVALAKNTAIHITSYSRKSFSEQDNETLKRFANVFEQAYTRFLDLQKAEAQAREAQIQLALERVRARTMAMHHSDELTDVVKMLYQEFDKLKLSNESTDIEIGLINEETGIASVWAHLYLSDGTISTFKIPLARFEGTKNEYKQWRNTPVEKRNEIFITTEFSGKRWDKIIKNAGQLPELAEFFKSLVEANISKWVTHNAYFSHGLLTLQGTEAYSPETQEIQKRFAKVFEQTYTRFLDLQKAEAQAREAKIEAALERTRTQSMIMQHSKELDDTLRVFHEQVLLLGIPSAFSFLWLPDEKNNRHIFWAAWGEDKNGSTVFKSKAIDYPLDRNEPATVQCLVDWKSNEPVYSYHVPPASVENYFAVWQELIDGVEHLKPEYFLGGLHYVEAFMKYGCFGVMVTADLTEDEKKLLNRFAIEFERTYTRFLDLQMAEAQARESQIQLALERVRARTMAMQRSDELSDVATVLFQQVKALGVPQWACGFCIWDIGDTESIWYPGSPDGEILAPARFPLTEHTVFRIMDESRKRGDELYIYEKEGELQADHYRYMMTLPGVRELLQDMLDAGLTIPTFQIDHYANFAYGNLIFITYEHFPEMHDIFKRFAKVFEQTYTRFLDLQKAEAQTRESQIQLALERVRARTMAMQKSDELMETAVVLFDQLYKLGENIERTIIGVMNEEEHVVDFWATRPDGSQMEMMQKFPIEEPIVMQKVYAAWQQQKKSIVIDLRGEELESYFQFLKGRSARLKRESFGERRVENFVFFSKGMLGVISADPNAPANVGLYERFAAVFDQTYTRFLDLQKAEAQTRESQIQLALERVRARTMAMQHSDELKDAAALLFQQAKSLGVPAYSCGYNIWEKNDKEFTSWMSTQDGSDFNGVPNIPLTEDANFIRYVDSKQKGEQFFVLELRDERMQEHYEYLKTIPAFKAYFDYAQSVGFDLPETQIHHLANFSQGNLLFITLEPCPEFHDVFKRFAAVFEQTYTRFLDLQKAEAQARESQIQLALERVRARTMAMQKSDELGEVSHVMNEQLQQLNFKNYIAGFLMDYKNSNDFEIWRSDPAQLLLNKTHIPYFDHPIFNAFIQSKEKGLDFNTLCLTFEEKNKWVDYVLPYFPALPKEVTGLLYSGAGYAISCAYMKNVGVFIENFEGIPFSEEENAILKRFGKVFEQTYTRFLDLQKAEVQARESQIELGLERVRARAMAMQSSNELSDLVDTLFKELTKLDFTLSMCIINIIDEPALSNMVWAASPETGKPPESYYMKFEDYPFHHAMMKGYKERNPKFIHVIEGEEKKIYDEYLFNETEFRKIPEEGQAAFKAMEKYVASFSFSNFGGLQTVSDELLSESNLDILARFGKVFDLTYTRFNDLLKAEAQAREAKIEAALERVRSRTMGMQKSDELADVVGLMYKQFEELDFGFYQVLVSIYDTKNKIIEWWSRGFGDVDLPQRNILPIIDHSFSNDLLDKWKSGVELYEHVLGGELKRSWDEYLFTQTDLKHFPQEIKDTMRSFDHVFLTDVFMKYGSLQAAGPSPLPDDKAKILKRFTKALDHAYTRMMDLQNAEAQAREAQIEVALERIRARAMAMHSSNELMDVANILREQMGLLDQPDLETSVVNLFEEDSGLIFSWNASRVPGSSEKIISSITSFPKNSSELTREMMSLYHSKEKEYTLEAAGLKLMEFLKVLIEANPRVADYIGDNPPEKVFYHFTTFTGGNLLTVSYQPPSEETKSLQRRAASVFDMAYRRYLDLKKAEAQAREAQIEVALERVRAKVMAMTNSKELNATSLVFGEQLRKLNIDWQFSYFWLIDEVKHDTTFWITWPDYKTSLTAYTIDEATEYFNDCLVAWRGGVKIHDNYVSPEGVQAWLDTFQRIADDAGGVAKEIMVASTFPAGVFYYDAMMKYGSFGICVSKPATDEEKKIQSRFAIEFERAYSRFLDLKQAEAQTREAKIEASLERVRAKAMAMHKSDDFNDAVAIVFEELDKLNLGMLRCGIGIFNKEKRSAEVWTTTIAEHGRTVQVCGDESMDLHPLLKGDFAAWLRQEDFSYVLEGEDMSEYYRAVMETNFKLPESQIMVEHPEQLKQIYYAAMFESGSMFGFRETDFPEEAKLVMKRFAGVFNLTYKRFLDLQKAEAQTREAQIELGLERVRAKAMAMQKSSELKELIGTVYTELTKLDLILDRCFIMIYDNKSMGVTWWMSNPEAPSQPIGLFVKYHEQPPYFAFIKGWKDRNLKWQYVLEGEVKKTWDKFLFIETELSQLPDFVIANMKANEKVYLSASFNNFGCLTLATLESLSDEHFDIMLRFAKVFDLTYTRFNDLKQAEAQAREAKIEAALERVRAKAMAMHKSEDLHPAVATVFEELDKLNIGILRCGIAIMDKEKPRGDVWITVKSEQSNTIQVSGDESLDYHPLLRGAYDGWLKQEDFSYVLQGEDLISYYRDVASMKYQLPVSISFDTEKKDQQQYYYNAVFQDGSLFAFMETAITDEAQKVIKRFANVFNLTYKRFLDLQKAEAQTREAKIEAALERVRARALAMQEPEELKDVAQVLRTEMGLLGVEELETCSIYINDEATNKTECWYALKDLHVEEKKLVSDHFPLNLNDTWVGREMKNFYRSEAKQVSIVMQGANRKEWINYCEERSAPFRGYYGEVIPDRTYHLYKFSHGAIGAAAAGDISAESWKLLSRAASVFSLAYSRFKDLTQARIDLVKLKEEKKRAEDALSDLQSAQKQLVQAEKMASLGELTAGIAHEIQNPLNFVNNFSDVSNELLEEMKQELATGNTQQALEIAGDVKENLEKILHHGKRADAIVKGMLQHSRANTGQKEPTDINNLAEEYLRLAYHGLRAKDKFFNAKFETDLDPTITKINIVPQEIGRVILNLINNSFYAVTEKKRTAGNGYEPNVIVSTKKLDDKVEIRVVDNGNGIPQKVLDKIFQPFFTTKPTGQGTGLGLSLSYDIVTKGHNGDIKVETKEGEGSVFTITLPMN